MKVGRIYFGVEPRSDDFSFVDALASEMDARLNYYERLEAVMYDDEKARYRKALRRIATLETCPHAQEIAREGLGE